MKRLIFLLSLVIRTILLGSSEVLALENKVQIEIKGSSRCVSSNGIPDHSIGRFPNRANPHSISAQRIYVCMPKNPQLTKKITPVSGAMGIAINGILFRPNTAGYWDPDAPRGHSRRGNRNWRLDIFGAKNQLGLDENNAHVGPNGLYHYHGMAKHLVELSGSSFIGYAGDGFEIHYLGDKVLSGWSLKQGSRNNGPGGNYDGTYNQDYKFIESTDKLDRCNGGLLDAKYVYFITNKYPFVPRCLRGNVSNSFNKSGHR